MAYQSILNPHPVTGPLTDTQLRAVAVPVSGTVTANISGTVPVSGAFYQATQPVSIASMPSTPVTGIFWQATQPVSGTITANAGTGTFAVSAASLPLPTGAATAAKQPALGTAGAASADVITVQGIASGVAQPVSGTFWQTTQPVSIATMPSTPVTGTFWQATQPVSLAALPALTTGANVIGALTANQSVNNAQFNGVIPLMGNGVTGTGSLRVTIASDNTAFNVTTTPVTPTPLNVNSAATTNATSVKGSAGTLYALAVSNSGAAVAFLKLYNKATAPTVGTDVPVLTIPIAASGVQSLNLGETGHRFATGIALAITNLVADSDTTAVAANQVKVAMDYI